GGRGWRSPGPPLDAARATRAVDRAILAPASRDAAPLHGGERGGEPAAEDAAQRGGDRPHVARGRRRGRRAGRHVRWQVHDDEHAGLEQPSRPAGLQAALAETLLDYGAALEGAGSPWDSALMTALQFGYTDTANTLVRRGAPVRDVAAAAGLGR